MPGLTEEGKQYRKVSELWSIIMSAVKENRKKIRNNWVIKKKVKNHCHKAIL